MARRPRRPTKRARPLRAPPPGCDPGAIVLTFTVAPEHAGLRLDRFLQRKIPRLSRTRANRIVRAAAYREDGTLRRPSERVRSGEVVMIVRERFREPDTPTSFGVLLEDELVVVVDKPAGLPVHPSATYHRNTLTYLLRQRYPERTPHLCHRLDRETSGVVVCARSKDAERALKRSFERREVDKSYLAIVRGAPEAAEGLIELPIGRPDTGLHLLMTVREDGAPARTRYRVREARGELALLELSPLTGRQHQLRVHLAAIGHPIVGDKLYGPEGAAPFLELIDTGATPELMARLGHHRHALHAHRLRVAHPGGGGRIEIEAPLPPDLAALWARAASPAAC